MAGVLGELLVTLGVIVLSFAAWQLWWTDLVADRTQAEEVRALEQRFTDAGVPASTGAPPAQSALVSARTSVGKAFAVIRIPRFGASYQRPVIQGTEKEQLDDGIGHEPRSVMPGQIGNFATAGHRVTYGKPYNRIDELLRGDAVVVETPDGWSVYRVQRHRIVTPKQVEVIAPVPDRPGVTPTERWMTMIACHPKFSARERYIAYAKLERFVPRADGPPTAALTPPT